MLKKQITIWNDIMRVNHFQMILVDTIKGIPKMHLIDGSAYNIGPAVQA